MLYNGESPRFTILVSHHQPSAIIVISTSVTPSTYTTSAVEYWHTGFIHVVDITTYHVNMENTHTCTTR